MLELRSRGGFDLLDQRLEPPCHLFEIVIDGRILQHVDGAVMGGNGRREHDGHKQGNRYCFYGLDH